ncbi:MAG: hypothetical protein NTZ60_10270 [Campylobacterales bacterium]|nr:hypothetical protein [Campylobacterales bacterium]
MAVKKKSVELSEKNIAFIMNKMSYKVIRFYPTAMSLDVMVHDENGVKIGVQNIPFAHVTKDVKKLIKPN